MKKISILILIFVIFLAPVYVGAEKIHKGTAFVGKSSGARSGVDSKNLKLLSAEIYRAIRIGNLSRVKAILRKNPGLLDARGGINLESDIFQESTPLQYACFWGQRSIAKYLMLKGADINSVNFQGYTPLHMATQNCGNNWQAKRDISMILISRGAYVNARNNYGDTPLHSAVLFEDVEIVKEMVMLLVGKGADLNIGNKDMDTPLHVAVHNFSEDAGKEAGELLIIAGADVNLKNADGKTALDFAVKADYDKFAKMLRKHGAKRGSDLE